MVTSLENFIKSNEIVESIKIPLINQEFLFICGVKNMKSLRKHFDKDMHKLVNEIFDGYDDVNIYTSAYVEYYQTEQGHYYLSLVIRKIDDNILKTLVHEIVHIMQHIRKLFFLNKTEVEFEAYLTEWIFEQVCGILKSNQLIK